MTQCRRRSVSQRVDLCLHDTSGPETAESPSPGSRGRLPVVQGSPPRSVLGVTHGRTGTRHDDTGATPKKTGVTPTVSQTKDR